jgi:hypothetical protein
LKLGLSATIRKDINTFTGGLLNVARAAKAFRTMSVHFRRDPLCDVNDDFKIDIRHIASIDKNFGWTILDVRKAGFPYPHFLINSLESLLA